MVPLSLLHHRLSWTGLLGFFLLCSSVSSPARAQLSSFSTAETRVESAPLAVRAIFDSSQSVSISGTGVVGLQSPWASTPIDFSRNGSDRHNYYAADGSIQSSLTEAQGSCQSARSFTLQCAEQMPLLRYDNGTARLADYYAIVNPSSSFKLTISATNSDQPSAMEAVVIPAGAVPLPQALPGASRYEVTLPGGTGMEVQRDGNGAIRVDASHATAGASGVATMVDTTVAPDQTTINTSQAVVRLDPPTAVAVANRVTMLQVAGANVNAIGGSCQRGADGQAEGPLCSDGVVATTEILQVWDPTRQRPVHLVRPRLVDADYVKVDPTLTHSTVNLVQHSSDTNQFFEVDCPSSGSACAYKTAAIQSDQGQRNISLSPINQVPLSDMTLETIMLPSYSTQSFSAGGVAADGLYVQVQTATGEGNKIGAGGHGTSVILETSSTVIKRQ